MSPTLKVLTGIGFGAGLMYLFDPVRGRGRRAMLRDRFGRWTRETRHAAEVVACDACNRVRGVWAATHPTNGKTTDSRTLVARVRSRLGRCVSHPRAIRVEADNGRVTLSGPVLAHEVRGLLAEVASVPGVRGVVNQLDEHSPTTHHPALQGGKPRSGVRGGLLQRTWSPSFRVLTGGLGVGLMANCLARRDLASALLGTVGFGLFLRAVTNTSVTEAVARMIPAPQDGETTRPLAGPVAGPV